MAEYKWGVEDSKLILKADNTKVAEISGGLISQLTANDQTFTTEQLNNYLTFTPYQAGANGQGAVPGKITLKETALAKGENEATITLTSTTSEQYTLGLEGADANSGKLTLNDAAEEKWETTKNSDTTTADHFSAGTPTIYTLSGNTITYKPKSTPTTADLTITGLKDMQGTALKPLITITEKTGEETEGTITIAASALPEGGDASLTVTLTTGAADYNLKFDSNATKFDTAESTPKITSVTGGTATIKRTQSAGWSEVTSSGQTNSLTYTPKTDKTLATVEGLSTDIKAGAGANAGKFGTEVEGTFVEAITVSGTTVTVAKNALKSENGAKVEVEDASGIDESETTLKNFTLALKDATNNKIGFEHIDSYWTLDGTTATYKNGTKEGWTLNPENATTDPGKIVYTKQVDNTLATISNLKEGVVGGDEVTVAGVTNAYSKIGTKEGTVFTEGITVNETAGTFTLTKDVLTTTPNTTEPEADNSTTLEQGTKLKADGTAGGEATTYKLALGTGATAPGTTAENPHLTEITTVESVKQTTVEGTKAAGWTLAEGGLKISYTADTPVTLATISGLAVNEVGEDVKIEGNTVVLTANAIGTMKGTGQDATPCSVTLTNENGGNYTIARAEDATAPGTTPSTFTLELSGESEQPKTVTVKGTKASGYTLDNSADVKKITYSAPAAEALATISNLNKDVKAGEIDPDKGKIGTGTGSAFVEGIKLNKDTGTITLEKAVLTKDEGNEKATKLEVLSAANTYNLTYKLALADGIKAPATEVTNQKITATTTTGAGKLDIVGTLTEGWVLDTTDNKKITYTAEKTPILATISGLKKNAAVTVNTNINFATTGENKGQIKLYESLLDNTDNSKVTITTTIETGGLTEGQTDSLKESYKFALADEVDAPGKTVTDTPRLTFPSEAKGTATLVGTKSAGWVLDTETNTVTRKPAEANQVVAEITGLSLNAKGGEGVTEANVTFDNGTNTVTLKAGSLTNKDVVITDKTTDTKYKLALDSGLNGYQNTEGTTAGFEDFKYWDKSGSTAKYYSNKKEGWTLDTTNNNKITYTPQTNGKLLATITNLNPEFTLGDTETDAAGTVRAKSIGTGIYNEDPNESTYKAGVLVLDTNSDNKDDTIRLSKNVLGTTAGKPMELTTTTDGNALTLALDARTETQYADLKVPDQATDANVWELGATSKYKEVKTAFWKLDDETNSATKGKKITYTAQTAGTVLATITGLNPDVTEDDLNITAHQTGGTQEAPTITKGTIELNAQALNKRNVTIDSKYYKLALNTNAGTTLADLNKKVAEPTLTNAKWNLNDAHTIATYTAKVTEGYEATSDGSSVIYTAAADSKEIAKVTGLNGDSKLGVSDDGKKIGIVNGSSVSDGLTLNADKVITLTKDVLGTSNLAVTGTNYTLALGSDITTANKGTATLNAQGNVTITAPAEQTVWRVSNGANNTATATYKKVIPYYYTVGVGATAITYTPEATAKINTGTEQAPVYKDAIIATVTGLKRGLTVADNGQSLNGTDEQGNAVTEVLTLNEKAVTLTKDALGTSHVTITKGDDAAAADNYTLSLGESSVAEALAPKDGTTFTWSVSSTTATLKGTATAGYTLGKQKENDTGNNKITYTPANANKTFAILTGLKSGITASELNTTDSDKPIDISGKVLTLDKRVLGATDVTLDKTNSVAGYTLDLDIASTANKVATTGAPNKVWDVSGTTATYKNVTEAFYTPAKQDGSTGNDKITYKGRTDGTVIATVTGLKSGLKVENDKIEGITLGTLSGSTFSKNEETGTVIQLSKDVLGTTEAAIGQGSYTLALGEGVAPERDGGTFWTISGGTNANYQFKQTAGHTLDSTSKKAAYSPAGTKTIVTIEGLKSGLKATDVEAGITVSNEEKDYTVSKSVLGTNATTTLKNGDAVSTEVFANYKIALATGDNAPAEPTADQVGWVKDGSNFILKSFTTPGYKIATDTNPKTITYTGWEKEKDLATVTGLNTKAKLDTATRQIDGIDLSKLSDSTHTVTLTKADVFSGKNVTIAKATNAAAEYTLAVDNSQNPKYSYEWAFKKGNKNGTATLTETMSAGYTLDSYASSETKGQIVHHNKETVTTTIAGLNNNVVVKDADKTKIGIYNSSASADSQYTGITFTAGNDTDGILKAGAIKLGANVLAEANVTLTNKSGGGKYTLALETTGDNKVTVGTTGAPVWHKTNETTAIYRTMTTKGYAVAGSTDDTKITYYSVDGDGTSTTLATLKGLNKNATVADLTSSITVNEPSTTTTTSGANVTGNNADPAPATTTTTTPGKFTIKDRKILTNTNLTLTGNDPNYKDYQLALDDKDDLKVTDIAPENATWKYSKGTANLNVGKTDGWSIKQTRGAKTETTADDAFDYKTIVYTKPAPVTIATVSGLAAPTKQKPDLIAVNPEGKKTLIDENGKDVVVFGFEKTKEASGTTPAEYKGTITLSANALTNKNVTVTIPKKITGYAFELATDGDVFEPEDGDNYWTADGKGKAVYQYDTAAGYTLDKQKEADTLKNKLTYSKEKTTTLATITGLATAATVRKDSSKTAVSEIKKDAKATEIDGIGVSSEPTEETTGEGANATTKTINGVLLLSNPSILGNKVTVTGDYEFNIADEYKVKDGGSQWYFKGGTATYKEYTLEGYAFAKIKNDDNKKVVNYKPETAGKTLVTIKGLAKKIGTNNITDEMVNGNGLLVVNEDHTVTISKDITGTATITLVNGVETPKSGSTPATYYDYQIDAANSTYTTRVTDAPVWTFNKGTATLNQATSAGFTLGELGTNGQQKLTYSKKVNPAVATVKGLNPNLAVATEDNIPAGVSKTVGQIYAATTTGTGKNAVTTINDNASAPAISYDGNVITVRQDALTTKNVTLGKKDEYTLALDDVVNKAENVDEWVVSGTTANYKNYDRAYHELNEGSKGITYVKPTKGITYATVTGLKKDTTIDTTTAFSGDKEGGVLTLKAENLGEKTVKIASKVAGKDTFTLALSLTDTDTLAKTSELTTGSWSAVSGGKSTLSGTQSAGFYAEFGGKQLTYLKANKSVTVATITGLKNGATVSESGGTVTLDANDLNKKNVTITTAMGPTTYKLSIDNSLKPTIDFDATATSDLSTTTNEAPGKTEAVNKKIDWAVSNSTGTLKGYVQTAGYTLSGSETAITYTGETARNKAKVPKSNPVKYTYTYKDATTLATFKGINSSSKPTATPSSTGGTITLSKSNINGNTLTLSGGTFAVKTDNTVTGKSIVGSAGADNIEAEGTKMNITGGKGDDKIKFASGGGNTLVYSNGDGNDVIANFDFTNDKIQVKSGAVSVGLGCSDNIIVKVGSGSINLGTKAGVTEIDILDKKGNKTTYAIAGATAGGSGNVLLEDNNYSMDAASLSDLVQGDSASFTPYDFSSNFSLTKEDKFIPAATYSDKK